MQKLGLTSHIITLYVLLGTGVVCAHQDNPWQVKDKDQAVGKAQLTITPSICVIKEKGDTCQQKLTVFFKSKKRHDICIYNATQVEPLWCDGKIKSVSLELEVNTSTSIKLVAKDKDSNIVLAASAFRLSTFKPAKKRKKRHYGIGIL